MNRSADLLCVGFLLSQVGALFHRNFVAGLMGLGLDNMGIFVVMFLGSLAQLQLQQISSLWALFVLLTYYNSNRRQLQQISDTT